MEKSPRTRSTPKGGFLQVEGLRNKVVLGMHCLLPRIGFQPNNLTENPFISQTENLSFLAMKFASDFKTVIIDR